MNLLKCVVLTSLALVGCNSFNKTEYHITTPVPVEMYQPAPPVATVRPEVVEPPEPVIEDKEEIRRDLCPRFVFPQLPPPPKIPIAEIEKLQPNDQRGMDKLTQKHIQDLRRHIQLVNSKVAKAKAKYHQDCLRFMEQEKP